MNFDTSWDVDKYKTEFLLIYTEEHWQWARAFLKKNKNKYYENNLVNYARKFIKVKFFKMTYRDQTMQLLKYLSNGLVVDWRDDSDDAAATQPKRLRLSTSINNHQTHIKNTDHLTPDHPDYILPGFILMLGITDDPFEILDRSCTFSNMALPFFKFHKSDSKKIKADLFIQTTLVASSFGSSRTNAQKNVSKDAYYKLKQFCFAIKIKKNTIPINKINVNLKLNLCQNKELTNCYTFFISNSNASVIISHNNEHGKEVKNYRTEKIFNSEQNKVILKEMDSKHGSDREIQFSKKVGFRCTEKQCTVDNKCWSVNNIHNIQNIELKNQIKEKIVQFINNPERITSFSMKCTTIERMLIHKTCTKFDLVMRSYGKPHSTYIVVFKKENCHEVFEKLINNGFEDDFYKLIPPEN